MNEANPVFTYDPKMHAMVCPELADVLNAVRAAARELANRWDGPVPRVGDGIRLEFNVPGGTDRIPLRVDVGAVTWDETGLSPHVDLTLALGTTNCPTAQREALVRMAAAMKAAGGQ